MRRCWVTLLLVIAGLFASGCSGFSDQDQVRIDDSSKATLDPSQSLGQTFVAQHAGLAGLEIWLAPSAGGRGEIVLHLRSELEAERDLATATVSVAQVTEEDFYRFSFPTLRDSHSHYYYALLQVTGEGQVRVGQGPGNAYLDGALYHNHEPLDAQMAFRLVYNPAVTALELAGAAARGAGLLAVAGLLYVVPGWALLELLWHQRLSWAEKLSLGAGISLALYPLFLLWTNLLGLHLGSLNAWLPVLSGIATLLWRYRCWQPRTAWESMQQWARSDSFWSDVTLLGVMVAVFGVRLLVVRTLAAPMWGDSYQHTMISQLLVDNGGLFRSWEPYVPLTSFTYHFGFHSAMAALHWVTGMAMHRAVLWGAQVLNGLAVLALYPLGLRVSGNRWGGIVAVTVAGLLSPMPMTYVNWGRYTQLTGQVILPTAVFVSWRALEAPQRDWHLIALSWLAAGGLALTHYRVLIFYIVFVLAWAASSTVRRIWHRTLTRIIAVGGGAALLFLPWFSRIFDSSIVRNFRDQLTTGATQTSSFTEQYNAIGNVNKYMGPALWLLLVAAVAFGLWNQRRGVVLVAGWWFLLFIATNPSLLCLPGSGAISNFALFIAVYIPAGTLIGYAGSEILRQLQRWRTGILPALLVVAIGLTGVPSRMADARPAAHAMVTRPDERAIAWIRENTPENAKFLVNSFSSYGGGVIVGSDAGWWLPLLAGRPNTVPPLNYSTEQGLDPEYRESVRELSTLSRNLGMDNPATLALLREHGVTHVYIGQQQGRVNYGGPHVLDPELLKRSDQYQLVYHQDRVWVFALNSGVSSESIE